LACHYRNATDGTKGFALPAKSTSERVQAMRAARNALGLKRLELYAHPDDRPAIKALAEKLKRRRAKLAAP
jgi:hypothetical protein